MYEAIPWFVIGVCLLSLLIVRSRTVRYEATELELTTRNKIKDYMPALITIIVLVAALFVILSGFYQEGEQKWAFGSIGTILGYWLKG